MYDDVILSLIMDKIFSVMDSKKIDSNSGDNTIVRKAEHIQSIRDRVFSFMTFLIS